MEFWTQHIIENCRISHSFWHFPWWFNFLFVLVTLLFLLPNHREYLSKLGQGRTNMVILGKPFLIGGWPTPLKNVSSSVGMIIPNWMEKWKTCSKPPTNFGDEIILHTQITSLRRNKCIDIEKLTHWDCHQPKMEFYIYHWTGTNETASSWRIWGFWKWGSPKPWMAMGFNTKIVV